MPVFKLDVRKRSFDDMVIPNDTATDSKVGMIIVESMQRLILKFLERVRTRR